MSTPAIPSIRKCLGTSLLGVLAGPDHLSRIQTEAIKLEAQENPKKRQVVHLTLILDDAEPASQAHTLYMLENHTQVNKLFEHCCIANICNSNYQCSPASGRVGSRDKASAHGDTRISIYEYPEKISKATYMLIGRHLSSCRQALLEDEGFKSLTAWCSNFYKLGDGDTISFWIQEPYVASPLQVLVDSETARGEPNRKPTWQLPEIKFRDLPEAQGLPFKDIIKIRKRDENSTQRKESEN